jgi:tetratricopeptide (TPR) repeat protein
VPAVPILILCGAFSVPRLVDEVRRRRWRLVIAAVLLFAAAFLFVANRRTFVVNKSAMYAFIGNHYMQRRDVEKAEEAFAEAYRLDPGNFHAQINYARALLLRGKPEESARFYASAFGIAPDYPNLAVEYGSLLDQMGRREDAKRLYRYAYELPRRRDRILACKHLARDALAEGSRDEAILWVRRALELSPNDKDLVEWLRALEGER